MVELLLLLLRDFQLLPRTCSPAGTLSSHQQLYHDPRAAVEDSPAPQLCPSALHHATFAISICALCCTFVAWTKA